MKLTFFILSEIGTSIYYLFLFLVLTMESTTSLPITQEIFLKKKKINNCGSVWIQFILLKIEN